MFQVWAVLSLPNMSSYPKPVNLYVYVFLNPLLDQVAVWILYSIKFTPLLSKQMWL